jgi:hypothetical protein
LDDDQNPRAIATRVLDPHERSTPLDAQGETVALRDKQRSAIPSQRRGDVLTGIIA